MKTPHKHATLIKAWADGATIEVCHEHCDYWVNCIEPEWNPRKEYRIKSETVMVNGVECPEATGFTCAPEWNIVIKIDGDKLTLNYETEADARKVFDALCLPFGDAK